MDTVSREHMHPGQPVLLWPCGGSEAQLGSRCSHDLNLLPLAGDEGMHVHVRARLRASAPEPVTPTNQLSHWQMQRT